MTDPKDKWEDDFFLSEGRYPTPLEIKVPRHPSPSDSDPEFIPFPELFHIRTALHRLDKGKADRVSVGIRFQNMEKSVNNSMHCLHESEFQELKEAVTGWRLFFRNTVAVGMVGAVLIVGGWLWQFYALSTQVEQTAQQIREVSASVSALQDDYQRYKNTTFETNAKGALEVDSKLMYLEYRLLSAIAKLSRGQPVDQPSSPPGDSQ